MKSPESYAAFNACQNKQESNSLFHAVTQYRNNDGTLHCPVPSNPNEGISNYCIAPLLLLDRSLGRSLLSRDQLNQFTELANEAAEKYNTMCALGKPEKAMIQNLVGNWNNV